MPAFKNWIKRCLGKLKCRLEGHRWSVNEDRYYCSRCDHLGADWEWHELTPEEEDIVIELYNQDPYIKLKDWELRILTGRRGKAYASR